MDAEVLMASQLRENCVRNGSDAHLEACTILDERSAMLSDRCLHLVRLAEMSRLKRCRILYEDIYHVHRDHGLSPRARDVRIYYRDYGLCAFDGREGSIDRCAQRYESVLVRRAYLDHRDVAAESSASVELLRLAEEYRDVVGIAGLDALAYVRTYEEGLMEENSVVLFVCIWCGSLGVEVMDAYILKFSCVTSSAEGLDKNLRCACNAAEMDVIA